jgi:hypothetical protein
MLTELITLPVRAGVRVARLSLYTAQEGLRLTGAVAEEVVMAVRPDRSEGAPTPAAEPEPIRRPRTPPTPASPPRPPVAPAPEPAHVSAEAVLVEEVAEAGAESGAGAEIHVDEPWPEYGRMTAQDIVARLEQAGPAELGAVQLYERTHRARQSVLTAAERQLNGAGGGPQPRAERKTNHG